MAQTRISHASMCRLCMLLPAKITRQLRIAYTDGGNYHLELWEHYRGGGRDGHDVGNLRVVRYPESWGLCSAEAIAWITLNAW